MAHIIPGYDFTITETPNKAKFTLQATELTVTNIDGSKIAPSGLKQLLAIEDTSNATLASSEGSMWISADGTLWGRNRWGLVKVRRPTGGWETNRFTINNWVPLYGSYLRRGFPFSALGGVGKRLEDSNIYLKYPSVGTPASLFIAEETAISGVLNNPRVLVRGFSPIFVNDAHLGTAPMYQGYQDVTEASLVYTSGDPAGGGHSFVQLDYETSAVDYVGGSSESLTWASTFPTIYSEPL